jgi:hypothetical protein
LFTPVSSGKLVVKSYVHPPRILRFFCRENKTNRAMDESRSPSGMAALSPTHTSGSTTPRHGHCGHRPIQPPCPRTMTTHHGPRLDFTDEGPTAVGPTATGPPLGNTKEPTEENRSLFSAACPPLGNPTEPTEENRSLFSAVTLAVSYPTLSETHPRRPTYPRNRSRQFIVHGPLEAQRRWTQQVIVHGPMEVQRTRTARSWER